MTKLLAKIVAVLSGVLLAVSLAVAPATADAPDVEYHIVTGPNGVKYKVITAVNDKPLVDQQGNPAPVRKPLVQPLINETDCGTGRPVHIRHGNIILPRDTCYANPGRAAVGISGVDWLNGGKWYGSVYYTTETQCIARPFDPGQTLNFSNDTLCLLSISHS